MNDIRQGQDIRAEGAEPQLRRPRVAVIVPNPCNPDYRVIKQAEFLAKQGYEVRVFCTLSKDAPSFEVFNGVTYRRIQWHVGEGLRRLLRIAPADPLQLIRKHRDEFTRRYSAFFDKVNDRPES